MTPCPRALLPLACTFGSSSAMASPSPSPPLGASLSQLRRDHPAEAHQERKVPRLQRKAPGRHTRVLQRARANPVSCEREGSPWGSPQGSYLGVLSRGATWCDGPTASPPSNNLPPRVRIVCLCTALAGTAGGGGLGGRMALPHAQPLLPIRGGQRPQPRSALALLTQAAALAARRR